MVVIDASVVYKWLVQEDFESALLAEQLLEKFLRGTEQVSAPDILLYEIGNILASKTNLSDKEVKNAWNRFIEYQILIYSPTIEFITNCVEFAKKNKVSVYDASYAVLAKEKGCNLITADKKFASQVNLPFIKTL